MKFLLSILCVGAGILLMQNFLRPTWVEIQSVRQQITEVYEAIGKANAIARLVDELQRKYRGITPGELDRIRGFLPTEENQEGLLVDMDVLAKDSKVKLSRIVFSEVPAAQQDSSNAVQALQFTFAVDGSYESFRGFLAALEKNLRVLDITEITLNRSTLASYQFTVTGKTYYQKEKIL